MSESLFNVGLVCKEHAPKAGKFKDCDPSKFKDELVKLGFPAINPRTGVQTTEHMWVRVHMIVQPGTYDTGEQLVGTLDNTPILECEYQHGDDVAFKVDEIEDVLIDFSP